VQIRKGGVLFFLTQSRVKKTSMSRKGGVQEVTKKQIGPRSADLRMGLPDQIWSVDLLNVPTSPSPARFPIPARWPATQGGRHCRAGIKKNHFIKK